MLTPTLDAMPRLLHLNGPPGIGKSTVAQLYVDEHPGVLNLDIDRLRPLIGGEDVDFNGTGAVVRPLALAMAQTHLRSGRDVIVPQYLAQLGEIERFNAIAHSSASAFVEIVLMDTKERSVDRFVRRGERAADPWHVRAADVVELAGGAVLLSGMYDALADVVRARPAALVVPSDEGRVPDVRTTPYSPRLRQSHDAARWPRRRRPTSAAPARGSSRDARHNGAVPACRRASCHEPSRGGREGGSAGG